MSDENERKKLDFSLPEEPRPPAPRRGAGSLVPVILIVLVSLNLYLTWRKSPGGGNEEAVRPGDSLSAGDLKQLALKLEQQGLHAAGAGTWREYLAAADEEEAKPAAIWYRIGTLHQQAGAHEEALAAFYRAESLGADEELVSEIGRRVQDSLEALGKFAALRHELAGRVGIGEEAGAEGGEVVAEIGAQKITRLELDREIEATVDNQLAMFRGQMPEEQLTQQKEQMLRQFSSAQQRLQFLNAYLGEEILYRKARQSKLIDDPSVRARLRDLERSLLARQVMEGELSGRINVSESDVGTYYEARKSEFVEPATVALSHIVVAGEEEARAVIARILDGEDFAALAKEISLDGETKEQGGVLPGRMVQGQALPGLEVPAAELEALFAAQPGDILDTPVQSGDGYHIFRLRERSEERQRPLEEVQEQIRRQLVGQKERELQAELMERLKEEYDVVIHQEAFGAAGEGGKE